MPIAGPYNIELVPASRPERILPNLAREQATFKPRWEKIRSRELERAGYQCEICGADARLECNEVWAYDDARHLQKLIGYKVVCPDCYAILHIGRTIQTGGLESALSHFIMVTGFTEDDLKAATSEALKLWKSRSKYRWRLDTSIEPLTSGFETVLNPGLPPSIRPSPRKSPESGTKRTTTLPQKQPLLSLQETQYLRTQHLARIATVSHDGVAEVLPVGFEFDGRFIWIGSHDQEAFSRTQRDKKFKNGSTRISLVVDDLESVRPWRPRGIKVSGTAEVVEHDGTFGKGKYLRITPQAARSWGIKKQNKPVTKDVRH